MVYKYYNFGSIQYFLVFFFKLVLYFNHCTIKITFKYIFLKFLGLKFKIVFYNFMEKLKNQRKPFNKSNF